MSKIKFTDADVVAVASRMDGLSSNLRNSDPSVAPNALRRGYLET